MSSRLYQPMLCNSFLTKNSTTGSFSTFSTTSLRLDGKHKRHGNPVVGMDVTGRHYSSLSLSLSVFICKCPNINSTNACKHEYVQIHVYHLIIIYTSTLPVALLTILLAPLQKFQVYSRKFGIMGHATVSNAPASCPSTATP